MFKLIKHKIAYEDKECASALFNNTTIIRSDDKNIMLTNQSIL